MTSPSKDWMKRLDKKYKGKLEDGRTIYTYNTEEIKGFIASELSSQVREIIDLTERMNNHAEMMEMKGTEYTEGFEYAISSLISKIKEIYEK